MKDQSARLRCEGLDDNGAVASTTVPMNQMRARGSAPAARGGEDRNGSAERDRVGHILRELLKRAWRERRLVGVEPEVLHVVEVDAFVPALLPIDRQRRGADRADAHVRVAE